MTYSEIVRHYINTFREGARAEMGHFESQRSLTAVIEKAARCLLPDGKRHSHQWRIPKTVLAEAERRLQAATKKIERAGDFEALHQTVKSEIGSVHGIGELAVYDIAHRLGAYLKKPPMLVHLHAGTRKGAAVFGLKGAAIDLKSLPAPFWELTAAEIEDCLCIYKDQLRGATTGRNSERASHCGTMPSGRKTGNSRRVASVRCLERFEQALVSPTTT